MPDLRPPSALFRLTHTVLQTGLRQHDGEELLLAKNLLNLASTLFAIAALLWLAACLGANSPLPVAGAAAVPLLAGLNLTLFARHGHVTLYARVLFGLMLAFPVVTQWLLGPVPAASGLPLWAALAPASALLCLGVAESTPWFLAFLLLTVAGGLSGSTSGNSAFMALHVTLVASVLYLQLRFAMGRRGKTRERLADAHRQLRQEQERSERLLLNILPAPIAARLKDNSVTIADGHPEVVVMFADIVDYTRIASGMNPPAVFEMLNRIFCRFDELSGHHGLERIKTIGDGYMVAGGLHAHPTEAHAAMAALALDLQSTVVGRCKFIYDLWGDTVNLAHRLCTEGEPSVIQCDSHTFERLRGAFVFAKPVLLLLKGMGYVPVYRLRNPRIFAVPPPKNPPTPAAA